MKRLFATGISIVILCLLFFYGCERNETMVLSGIVEVREISLGFEEAGGIEKINVDVNNIVKKGDSLASLDSSHLILEYQSLEFDLKHSKIDLKNLQTMPRPEELSSAKAIVESKEAIFNLAKDELKRAKELHNKKIQSEQKYQQYLAEYKRSEGELKAARNEAKLIELGTKTETIESQKMQIKALEKKVLAMKNRLEKRELISPLNGTVLTRNFEQNEYIKAGQTLISIADLNDCWIKIYLPESALLDVSIGSKVDVIFDSRDNLRLTGHISEIAQEASFAPRMNLRKEQRSDIYFPIKISVQNNNHRLKPGMPADVYFSY